jgi:hypothetical protein
MTTREMARNVIDALPEDASLDDIMEALYLRAKLERAERSIEEGRGIPHEEAKKRLQVLRAGKRGSHRRRSSWGPTV